MAHRTITIGRSLAVALLAAGGLAACSGGGDSNEAAATTTAASAPKGGDEASGDPETNGAAKAGIDLENPPDPIGEVVVPIDQDGVTQTKVEVLEAKRRGKVLLVAFRFTPEGTTSDEVSIFKSMGEHSFAPALIDLDNLKKYQHVPALTVDEVAAKVSVGEPLFGFAAFPPPHDDVDTVDLLVSDLAPPIEDLQLP